MAGIWGQFEDKNLGKLECCFILTTGPNGVMKSIHHRMPVILQPQDYSLWLNQEADLNDLQPLFWPVADDCLKIET